MVVRPPGLVQCLLKTFSGQGFIIGRLQITSFQSTVYSGRGGPAAASFVRQLTHSLSADEAGRQEPLCTAVGLQQTRW